MPVGTFNEIKNNMPQNVSLLGMDVGKKTIGLAVCDPTHTIVTPLKTISRKKFSVDVKVLGQVVRDYEIGGFVIGLPLHMSGEEGRRAQSVRDFALEMLNHPTEFGQDPWIALYDERLSTHRAESVSEQSFGIGKRKSKAKGITDQLAAVVILEDALSSKISRQTV